MARLRKWIAYRKLERPNTRVSKYRAKSYVRANPNVTIARFQMGELSKDTFKHRVSLVTKQALQIRHNALESARMTCNRMLEKTLGKTGYKMIVRIYPFHICRENPLAAGAGADRMSTGMAHSFGKPITAAAQVKANQTLISVDIDKQNLDLAKRSIERATHKLPCACKIVIQELAVKKK